jgi:hypothetical protein
VELGYVGRMEAPKKIIVNNITNPSKWMSLKYGPGHTQILESEPEYGTVPLNE